MLHFGELNPHHLYKALWSTQNTVIYTTALWSTLQHCDLHYNTMIYTTPLSSTQYTVMYTTARWSTLHTMICTTTLWSTQSTVIYTKYCNLHYNIVISITAMWSTQQQCDLHNSTVLCTAALWSVQHYCVWSNIQYPTQQQNVQQIATVSHTTALPNTTAQCLTLLHSVENNTAVSNKTTVLGTTVQ